jgi:hypothetical protein
VAFVSGGVHDFVEVTDGELCGVGFEGGEAVAKFRGGSVEGCAGKVTHLHTEETAERSAMQFFPSKRSSGESLKRPS